MNPQIVDIIDRCLPDALAEHLRKVVGRDHHLLGEAIDIDLLFVMAFDVFENRTHTQNVVIHHALLLVF